VGDDGHDPDDAGRYRGTVPLRVAAPGWPWELVLIALDVWEGCVVLRGTAALDDENPFRCPSSWGITTTDDVVHTRDGGGAHGRDWNVTFLPSLPDDATEVGVFLGPPASRRRRLRQRRVSIDLAPHR
jgi:hypothetical protein